MNKLADKYAYRVDWSQEDEAFVSRVVEFPSLAAHGNTPEKALSELRKVVRESLKWMEEEGEELPQPISLRSYSGEFRLRMPPEVHRELAREAAEEGVSLNHLIVARAIRRVDENHTD